MSNNYIKVGPLLVCHFWRTQIPTHKQVSILILKTCISTEDTTAMDICRKTALKMNCNIHDLCHVEPLIIIKINNNTFWIKGSHIFCLVCIEGPYLKNTRKSTEAE